MSLSPAVGTSPSWPFFPFDQRCNKAGLPAGPGNRPPNPGGHCGLLVYCGYVDVYLWIDRPLHLRNFFSFPPSMTAQPGAPEHKASLTYFSFVTMAPLGYGDIVPVHPVARMFAIIEALTDLL